MLCYNKLKFLSNSCPGVYELHCSRQLKHLDETKANTMPGNRTSIRQPKENGKVQMQQNIP